ncbi:cytochrome-c peroxidase [Rhodophyticola porphyridii]|uniref:cytochrome-c peroxidase n=1 Tax=Rhodophyticola porphyridii TaxID=1852017 RepID=UPI0035D0280B
MKRFAVILGGASVLALAAAANVAADTEDFPPLQTLGPPPIPADNPMSEEIVELGEMLFWDGRLSGNGTMPCSACHLPDVGWGNGTPISFGYSGNQHWRNSQTILNSAYYTRLFWDGSQTSLEAQARAAAGGAVGGNGDGSMMEMRLRFVPDYVERFNDVFGTDYPRVSQAWNAIAAFQRTVVTDAEQVPFDRYLAGDEGAMSDSALRGMELFNGEAGCIACHNGALGSNQQFYNTGVPTPPEFNEFPEFQLVMLWETYAKGASEELYRTVTDDMGLYHVTKRPGDIGSFRTPSVRELVWTVPYMHNGVFATLEDVVAFYNAGGGEDQTAGLEPLNLDDRQMADLVAFLEALSMDEPLLMEPPEIPETATWAEFDQ